MSRNLFLPPDVAGVACSDSNRVRLRTLDQGRFSFAALNAGEVFVDMILAR
jgi:hypothetical protein